MAGYRLGTAEIESALVSHPAVAEAAVIGLPHEVKGHVATHLGPIVRPEKVTFLETLPKTRSGKIMRRVLKARALGMPEGDVSTLEE